jgi:uncharacterized protein YndB with AHSA1/START domain
MNAPSPMTVTAQMLIRRPVNEVFRAFVDPAITSRFWFTRSSGPLVEGADVIWAWDMFGVSTRVSVKAIEMNARISIEWDDPPCPVEWFFEPRGDQSTLVRITNSGFRGNTDEVVAQAIDAKGGFTAVLAGLKAWLEHGIELHLVRDQFPDAQLNR